MSGSRGSGPGLRVAPVSLERYRELWARGGEALRWPCLFTLPAWLEAWTSTLGSGVRPYLWSVSRGDRAVALAPLLRDGEEVRFLGDPEVCDYQDLVLAEGEGEAAVAALCAALRDDGVRALSLGSLRPESHSLRHLAPWARAAGAEVRCVEEGVSVEIALPEHWDDYLDGLPKKQRHELRRKLRRLEEAGAVGWRCFRRPEDLGHREDLFLALFRANRGDKLSFMDTEMESYFRTLLRSAARDDLARLGVLTLDGEPAAATLSFDHGGRTHLYNNGYRDELRDLSVGFLSKVFDLQRSLEEENGVYDLLKGDETYKLRLGGETVSLYRCSVRWSDDGFAGRGEHE